MKRRIKVFSLAMTAVMLYQLCFPVMAYALTGGPSQPEVESFEPVGTSEMVDVFSGDFTYNIPLIDVDGYPVNIAYNSGITMDQEASWVGLGWNINPGVINRNMRGLPDDFNGDEVKHIQYIKPNRTYGVNLGVSFEMFGKDFKKVSDKAKKILEKLGVEATISLGLGISYNNYTGLGIETSITPAISAGKHFKTKLLKKLGVDARLRLATSNKDGLTIQPSIGMNASLMHSNKYRDIGLSPSMSVSMSVNSRSGIKQLSVSASAKVAYRSKMTKLNGMKPSDSKKAQRKAIFNAAAEYVASGSHGINGSISIDYGTQTYQPAISQEMNSINLSLGNDAGAELFGANPAFSFSRYFAGQSIKEVKLNRKAFGNLYAHNMGSEDDMMDFNREKEGSFSEKNPTLAIPVYTYDVYAASGQGVNGNFKPIRNDIPVVNDPKMLNKSLGLGRNKSLGSLNLVKAGMDITVNFSRIQAGKWAEGNKLLDKVGFVGNEAGKPLYEPVYFKNTGEKSKVNTNSLHFLNLDNGAIRPHLDRQEVKGIRGEDAVSSGSQVDDVNGTPLSIPTYGSKVRVERDKRNTLFTYFTNNEKSFCLNKQIKYFKFMDETTYNLIDPKSPVIITQLRPNNAHIAEIGVTRPDGARYIYSIPAYNNAQYEVSFTHAKEPGINNHPALNINCETGQVNYSGNSFINLIDPTEAQIKARKNKGLDHAYNVTHTPAYAHSYLLTDVLSADYVDVTGNGVSSDDLGNYTKIHYYKTNNNYKWRVPYHTNMANYNEGLKSDPTDDNANVMYGIKETWHMSKIEGRNHYALFYLSERVDAKGVANEHGGTGTSSSWKLDKIELYNKASQQLIKTVHFEYDYSLCPVVDNNLGYPVDKNGSSEGITTNSPLNVNKERGKLTLKKIYFTYGTSTKGKFSAYEFNYNTLNPKYNLKAYDRWGNYKPNNLMIENGVDCNRLSNLSNAEFPYVNQDKTTADQYAAAWSLDEIVLPSGGKITVQYEADDYAYVQDKQAMQMVKIKGFADYDSWNTNTDINSINLSGSLYDEKDPKECIFFDLPQSAASMSSEDIRNSILRDQDGIFYYNCLVNLNNNETDANYEYVRGYSRIDDAGVVNMEGETPVGWIKVQLKDGNKQHPIAHSAWQFARLYLPHIIYPGSNLRKDADADAVSQALLRGLFGFMINAIEMIDGVNDRLRRNGFGNKVNRDKSWIRISNITGFKYGGGCRVKRLTISDNWQNMVGSSAGVTMTYGQEYDYTTLAEYNGTQRIISSGVASYEPALGGDENACKMPYPYTIDNAGVPDDEFYSEEPFGESYYPSPSVGYSRVSVKNIIPVNASAHGTGKTVHLYYTAKDFPVITSATSLGTEQFETSALFQLLGFKQDQSTTMSQGFQVEVNDMHGKPAGTLNYSQALIDSYDDEKAYSGIKYHYAIENEDAKRKKLSNKFKVVNTNNTIENAIVGVEVDMVMDTRKHMSNIYDGGIELNYDASVYGIPLIPAFMIWPSFSSERTTYKSAVLTRVVNRYGLLKATEAFEEGSHIRTENILLDAETGETLLTQTFNEYNDPVFNFTMPAHWAYDGMGQAYKNTGLVLDIEADNADENCFKVKAVSGLTDLNMDKYFSDGDVLGITAVASSSTDIVNTTRYVQKQPNGNNPAKWYLLNQSGSIYKIASGATLTVKIIQSGRKNMQALAIMNTVSLAKPFNTNGTALEFNAGKNILSASATAFSNHWRTNSVFTQNCSVDQYHRDLITTLNYLLSSGQLTTANYDDYLIEQTPANFGTIIPNLAGNSLYNATTIKAMFDDCGQDGKFRTTSTSGSTDAGFGISLGFNSCFKELWFHTKDADLKTALRMNNADYADNIMPNRLEWVNQVDNTHFIANVYYTNTSNIEVYLPVEFRIEGNIPSYVSCNCEERFGQNTNPFLAGIEGQWRKQADWLYYGERNNPTNNLRKDGAYKTFSPFWSYSGTWSQSPTDWTKTNEVTKYNTLGAELENKDALGHYSAALFNIGNPTLPKAVAANAAYQQILNYNFEDKSTSFTPDLCPSLDGFPQANFFAEGHTGKASYRLNVLSAEAAANTALVLNYNLINDDGVYDNGLANNKIDQNSVNGVFNPTPGKYVISAWVKEAWQLKVFTYHNVRINVVTIGNQGRNLLSFYPKGPIINGWQKIEGEFTITNTDETLRIIVVAREIATYIDDIRIHPYDAKMKTFIYNSLGSGFGEMLKAELDENNYATFYEYNAEGQLVRVKKETEKGIVTLKEVRNNQRKIYPAQ